MRFHSRPAAALLRDESLNVFSCPRKPIFTPTIPKTAILLHRNMEALAALSLAGNVIQFIEFGSKLFSQGCELYKSADGRLAVDDELRLITIELKEFIRKIQGAGITDQPNTSETTLYITGATPDSNFENICYEAAKIAEAILSKLTHRKLDKGRNRKLESFKRVWSQIWSQGEFDSLYGRLSRLREAIHSGILAAILSVIFPWSQA